MIKIRGNDLGYRNNLNDWAIRGRFASYDTINCIIRSERLRDRTGVGDELCFAKPHRVIQSLRYSPLLHESGGSQETATQ
jgi:hypothetical protein